MLTIIIGRVTPCHFRHAHARPEIDVISSTLIVPLDGLAFVPLAALNTAVRIDNLAISMLAAVDPLTFKAATILHEHDSRSVLLVVLVLTLVATTVRIGENSLTVHFIC